MSQGMTNLADVLHARRASMEEMIRLLAEEREATISCDTERLHEATARKLEVAAAMEVLDGNCRQLMANEAERLGLPANATLSPIIARSAPAEQAELTALQKKIAFLAGEIRQLVDDNRRFLGNSIATINRSLAFFQSRFTVSETYGGSGQMVERGANSSLLRREI
ncbi:FlgN family protein [Geobacter metallireducens RCH3]|uniref:Flagellar biogenesis chaperone FlgN n=1 Tax=Geobacter metallireducens (strain ATCC 53774 / DSM 7210 / GS-15) TaxID=269799 RepID=Q39YJ4_GEOMG|nr:flagellar protein FlgN [Geobacter metallireducens]ABB30680.1 flagellar biogenesis chaperone FlgN [Geobacter metallireducens GS-15]EHP88067.1 FlgN family protein [Geobacter metallireducens RCH3]